MTDLHSSTVAALSKRFAPLLRIVAVFVAPVILMIVATHELAYNASPALNWALVLIMIWTLVWRRRAPVLVFGANFAILIALLVLDIESLGAFSMLVAVYSVAAHRDIRIALGAGIALELGVVLVAQRFAPSGSIGDAVAFLSGLAVGALFLGTTFRAQRRYLASVEDRAARSDRERVHLAEIAAAGERARIAREMHDIVAHSLSVVITLSEGAAEATSAEAGPGREAMKAVAAAGRQSLSEMRNLLNVLRSDDDPDRHPQPMLADIASVVDDVRRTGLEVTADIDLDAHDLGSAMEATLFRIVQESLTNVLKHAPGARRVNVVVIRFHDRVTFAIENDGGKATAADDPSGGNGILGIRERVALFHGVITAGPSATGWAVSGYLSSEVAP